MDWVAADAMARIVVLRVVHGPAACEECLIPDDMMGPLFTTAFRRVSPEVVGVRHRAPHDVRRRLTPSG